MLLLSYHIQSCHIHTVYEEPPPLRSVYLLRCNFPGKSRAAIRYYLVLLLPAIRCHMLLVVAILFVSITYRYLLPC